MRLFYDKKFARLVLAVVMVSAFLLGGARQLNDLRAKSAEVAVAGAFGDGIGVATDVVKCRKAANNLAFAAEQYLPGDEDLTRLKRALQDFDGAGNKPADVKIPLAEAFETPAYAVYHKLDGVAKGDAADMANINYNDLLSALNTLRLDGYNVEAAGFNAKLSRFPAAVIKMLGLVKNLNVAGGN